MGRFTDSNLDDDAETAVDISPLIDVVFILLIFFIVTTVFVEETGVEVDKPQAASSQNLEKNSILIAIEADGTIVYGGGVINIGQVQPLVKRLTAKEDMPVILTADKASETGRLMRVLDEVKLAGEDIQVSVAAKIGQ